jgi:hypothetical protein
MKLTLLLPLFVALAMSSCCENGAAPNGTSSNGNGSIAGEAILFDSTGAVLTDFSGVSVTVDGTSMLAVSSTSGTWQFDNMPVGVYNVTATKASFGTFHWYQQALNDGHIDVATAALARMPNYSPSLGTVSYGANPGDSSAPFYYVNVVGSFPPLRGGVSIAGYCDLDSMVEPGNPHLVISPYLIGTTVNNGNIFAINASDLFAAGARPGQTLYSSATNVFAKQFFSTNYDATFIDPLHNNEVRFASNGPKSNVLSFVMR